MPHLNCIRMNSLEWRWIMDLFGLIQDLKVQPYWWTLTTSNKSDNPLARRPSNTLLAHLSSIILHLWNVSFSFVFSSMFWLSIICHRLSIINIFNLKLTCRLFRLQAIEISSLLDTLCSVKNKIKISDIKQVWNPLLFSSSTH